MEKLSLHQGTPCSNRTLFGYGIIPLETIVPFRQAKHFLKQGRGRKEEERRAAGTAAQRGAKAGRRSVYSQECLFTLYEGFT